MEQDKLKKQLSLLTDPHQLELFGKTLLPSQMVELLDLIIANRENYNEKLSPILAGFLHENFIKLLLILTPFQQSLLKHESMAIPLQHHLSILSEDKMKVFEILSKLYLTLDMIIDHLDVEQVGLKDYKELEEKIQHLELTLDDELTIVNHALLLAWNSTRIDLIEKFSLLKESFQKYKNVTNGTSNVTRFNKMGIHQKLLLKLNTVYAKISDLNVPAIDALAALSVWCLQDYFELGLLPDTPIDQNPAKHSEKEREEYNINQIEKVKKKLEAYGLSTLGNLKAAGIYSKKALREYLFLKP